MRHARRLLVLALALFIVDKAPGSQAGKELVLSNGVSFPSNNSALFENPAVLGFQKIRSVQMGVFFDGSTAPNTGTASLVADVGGIGFGLGSWKSSPKADSFTAGIGKRFGIFGLGVNTTYQLQNGAAVIDVGSEFELKGGMTVGAVLYHLNPEPAAWTLGLANMLWDKVILELDFESQDMGYSFEPASIRCLAGFTILLKDFLGVRVGYPFVVYPTFDFNNPQVELGLAVNFTKNVSAFVVHNQHPGIPYFIGLTFR